uniref:BFN1 n=1 Tax=Arundo donax TaxID=35708 RepID=A0A0A8YI16_ARUDO
MCPSLLHDRTTCGADARTSPSTRA